MAVDSRIQTTVTVRRKTSRARPFPSWYLLAIAGLICIGFGGVRWYQTREIESVAERFARAMQSGNRAAAVELLAPETRQLLIGDARWSNAPMPWPPTPDLQFQLGPVHRTGNTASVDIMFERSGFSVTPRLTLKRSAVGDWRIARIANPGIDPRWVALQHSRRQAEQARVATQLEHALHDRPGVEVSRGDQGAIVR